MEQRRAIILPVNDISTTDLSNDIRDISELNYLNDKTGSIIIVSAVNCSKGVYDYMRGIASVSHWLYFVEMDGHVEFCDAVNRGIDKMREFKRFKDKLTDSMTIYNKHLNDEKWKHSNP